MATYYASSLGNDGNPGTSELAPLKTAAAAAARAIFPGDVALFRRGDVWRETLTPAASGTAGNPITFGAYGTGDRPVFNAAAESKGSVWAADGGGFSVYSVAHTAEAANNVWTWEDGVRLTPYGSLGALQASSGGGSYFSGTTNYIKLADLSSPITNGRTYDIGKRLRGVYDNARGRIIFEGLAAKYHCGQQGNFEITGADNRLRDCHSDQGGYHCMLITGPRCVVGNDAGETGNGCYIGSSQSGCIVFFTGSVDGVCRGCTIEQNYDWGNWCAQAHGTASGTLYENNIVKRAIASPTLSGAFTFNDATCVNTKVRRNRIEGYQYNVLYLWGAVTGVEFTGNVAYVPNLGDRLIRITNGTTLAKCSGNTLYVGNVDKIGLYADATSTIADGDNNVIWTGWPVWQDAGGTIAGLNYNRYYSHRASPFNRNGVFTDFAGWQAASGQDANSTFGDPLFTSATTGDLTPATGSPLLGTGTDLGDAYVSAVDVESTFPLEGDEVADQSGNWNIGAYVTAAVGLPEPAGDHYTTAARVELEMLGEDNRTDATDGDRDDTEDAGQMEDSLSQADDLVDLELMKAVPPPATFPVVSSIGRVNSIITTAATKIATGIQFNKRDHQANRVNDTPTRGDHLIAEGRAMLVELVAAGLPGVTTEEEDEAEAGELTFVPIVRDVCDVTTDENYRPVLWY